MNKETRTWLTGVLIYFVGMYGLSKIDNNEFLGACSFIIDIIFIAYGFSLILKTIDK